MPSFSFSIKNRINYYKNVKLIERSPLFDKRWYSLFFPDLEESGKNPAAHYLDFGWQVGINPSTQFNTDAYLQEHPDIKQVGINPLLHYERHGRKEGRLIKAATDSESYLILSNTPLFDAEWYLQQYPEVAEAQADPISHYLLLGASIGYNPSKDFYTKAYLNTYQDVKNQGINPLLHYEIHEKNEGRSIPKKNEGLLIQNTLCFNKVCLGTSHDAKSCSVDLILYVHNDYDKLQPLINRIATSTDLDFKLFMIDDASSDKRVPLLLKNLHREWGAKMCLIKNYRHLGLNKSLHKALRRTKNHVALLTSDCILPEHWCSTLFTPILKNTQVASVSPFEGDVPLTNLPAIVQDDKIIDSINTINKKLRNIDFESDEVQLQTNAKTCVALNRRAIEAVQSKTPILFSMRDAVIGDWYLMTKQQGFHNAIAANLFIGKWSDDCTEANQKSKVLRPLKGHGEHNFYSAQFVVKLLKLNSQAEKTLVWLDHMWGGGAESYTLNQIEEFPNHLFLRIQSNNEKLVLLTYHYKGYSQGMIMQDFDHLNKLLEQLCYHEIVLNNLASYADSLSMLDMIQELKKQSQAKVIFKAHDFQAICPGIVMLIEGKKHCFCQQLSDCHSCPTSTSPLIPIRSIQEWHQGWGKFFEETVDEACFFSEDTQNTFLSLYPMLTGKTSFLPHQIKALRRVHIKKHASINIGVLGCINYHKGAQIIEEMIGLLDHYPLVTITIVGTMQTSNQHERFKILGSYEPTNLPNIFEENQLDIIFISSIWPETFSYTTEEALSTHLPVACFNLGAPPERVSRYAKGLILSEINAKTALEEISQFILSLRSFS